MPTPPRADLDPRPQSDRELGAGSASRAPFLPRWAAWAAVVAAVGLSVSVASAHDSLRLLMLLGGGAAAILLAGLALFRFYYFVLAVLVLAPSLPARTGQGSGVVDPTSLVSVGFMAAALLWLLARRRSGYAPNSPLRVAIVALLAVSLFATIGSERPVTSLVALLQLAAWGLMFVVLDELVATRRQIYELLGAIGLSCVVPVVAGLAGAMQSEAGSLVEQKGTLLRVTSTFGQSNNFGRYLMLLLIMAWAVQAFLPRAARWMVLAGSVPAVFLVMATYTRSAWLGLAAGVVVIGLLQNRRLLIGVAVVATVLVTAVPPVHERIFTTASPYEDAQGSVAWRLSYWQELLPMAAENPLTGIGLGVTRFQTEEGKAPHNDYLRFLVETGVVGLVAYLGFAVALVTTAARGVWRRPHGLTRGLGVGFAGSVGATLLVSAVANVVLSVAYMWYLMAFAAAVTSAVRQRDGLSQPAGNLTPDVRGG